MKALFRAPVLAAVALALSPITALCEVSISGWHRPIEGVHPGELLLGELNCVACHSAGETVVQRLHPATAPSLANAGARLTPQFIQQHLASPHQEKPGTTMPDVLHELPQTEKDAVIDSLTHYLMSLGGGSEKPIPLAVDPARLDTGRRLFHELGCVACHSATDPAPGVSNVPESLRQKSVPLGNLAHKTTVQSLAAFLVDPLKTHPSGRMPSLGLSGQEATAIAIYLLRDQAPGFRDPSKMDRVGGLEYHYFEARRRPNRNDKDEEVISQYLAFYPGDPGNTGSRLERVATGIVDQIGIQLRERDEFFGFFFTGYLNVPADGQYTFYTTSDDGSRLYIGDTEVVNNDGDHGMVEQSGSIRLTAGDHPIRISYYERSGGEGLEVRWSGPGISKQELPADRLFHMGTAMEPTGQIEFVLDNNKAMEGRKHFNEQGCIRCHDTGSGETAIQAASTPRAFNALTDVLAGCLAESPAGNAVQYDFSDAQREALREAVRNRNSLQTPLTEEQAVTHRMARLNCYACHERNGKGGIAQDRRPYFQAHGEVDLGDEGRIPPLLTGVGAKLNSDWMREVLLNGAKARPYMATRMPVFGVPHVEPLIEQFARLDGGDGPDRPVEADFQEAKFGRKLVGTGGLSCIACHNFGEYQSLGIPAMDLTLMTKRLRKEWFHRYMVDPASLRPGTRMPSFWPEGQAANTEIFDGDTHRQIDAIWAFLDLGGDAPPPDGLVQGQWEIAANQEAVIYRHFIEGAGTRAIGVGYPEKANLAWDANQMRLAMIWQGPFIDAAQHRSGRGQGFQGPLGHNAYLLPEGPPLAELENLQQPWPDQPAQPADYRMRGYQLDQNRRPAFRFDFQELEVTDYPIAVPGVVDANFMRRLTFKGSQPATTLWFRAATGDSIEKLSDGAWQIDGRLRMKFTAAPGAVVKREIDGTQELLVPVRLNNGSAEIVQEIIW